MTEVADDRGHMDTPEVDREAIRKAKYALLANRACTEQAKQLVEHVFDLVMKTDGVMHTKTGQQIRRGVEGLLGDLLQAAGHEHAKGHVYRSLNSNSFAGEEVGYRAFKLMIDRLMALGFLERLRGYQDRFQWEADGPAVVARASASRFKATPALLELAARFGVHASEAKDHFLDALPRFPLRLRASSRRLKGEKVKGRRMQFTRTPETERVESDVRELNEFFDQFALRGGTHRGFIRIFNQGDDPEFAWNMGGRLYSQGEDNFQLMKKEDRLKVTINGEPVCEIDIRASYLTIYLAWSGQPLDWARDPDPYLLPGVPRDIAKHWFTATFGHHQHLQKWPTGDFAKDYLERTGRKIGQDFPLKQVREKAVDKFALLATWGKRKNAWAELMYQESEAVVSTLLRLKREHGIPSLAVHDSIIVPVSKRDIAEQVLTDEYLKVAKVKPKLETSIAN